MNERITIRLDNKEFKERLQFQQNMETKQLESDVKTLLAALEHSKRDRAFFDDLVETPDVALIFHKAKPGELKDELHEIQKENRVMETSIKNIIKAIYDKNTVIQDTKKIAIEICEKHQLPEGFEDNQEFTSNKNILLSLYNRIIKSTIDFTELDIKCKVLDERTKQLEDKFAYFNSQTESEKMEKIKVLLDDESVSAKINSLDLENESLSKEISRMISELNELESLMTNIKKKDFHTIISTCADYFNEQLYLTQLIYDYNLHDDDEEDLLERIFEEDKDKWTQWYPQYEIETLTKLIPIKKRHVREINEASAQLDMLRHKAMKVHDLNRIYYFSTNDML